VPSFENRELPNNDGDEEIFDIDERTHFLSETGFKSARPVAVLPLNSRFLNDGSRSI